jgi:hypothetical protein
VCRDYGVTREYLRVLVFRAKQSFKSYYLRATRNVPSRTCSTRVSSLRTRQRSHHTEEFPVVHGLKSVARET